MEHKIVFLMFIFIIYSFFGWLVESLRISIKKGRLYITGLGLYQAHKK